MPHPSPTRGDTFFQFLQYVFGPAGKDLVLPIFRFLDKDLKILHGIEITQHRQNFQRSSQRSNFFLRERKDCIRGPGNIFKEFRYWRSESNQIIPAIYRGTQDDVMMLETPERRRNERDRKTRNICSHNQNGMIGGSERRLKGVGHACTKIMAHLIPDWNLKSGLHGPKERMLWGWCSRQYSIAPFERLASFEQIQHETSMKTGGFIRRERRAETCFDLPWYRRFGKHDKGG